MRSVLAVRRFARRPMRASISTRLWLGSLGVLVALCFSFGTAHAFPSSRLIYVRAKGTEPCPGEDVVRAEVAHRLGYDPFFAWAERTIVAQLSRDARGLHATVQLLDEKGVVRGSRSLRASSHDCAELVKAVALAISIGIDSEHATGTPRDSDRAPSSTNGTTNGASVDAAPDRSEASRVPAPQDERDAPRMPADADRPDPPPTPADPPPKHAPTLSPEVGAGLWSAINLAPAPAFGAAVFGGVHWGPAALYVEGRKSLPASGNDIRADTWAVAVLPCFDYRGFFACINASWGELRVVGDRTTNVTYAALGGRVGAEVPVLRQFFVRSHVDVLGAVDRTLVLRNRVEAWQLPALSAALALDGVMHF